MRWHVVFWAGVIPLGSAVVGIGGVWMAISRCICLTSVGKIKNYMWGGTVGVS